MRPADPPPPDARTDEYRAAVLQVGLDHGLHRVGVADARVMQRARDALAQRRAAGLADTMQFTYRNPTRSTDPGQAVRGARSVVVGARSYSLDAPAPAHQPSARIARYAWADHYGELREALWAVARRLRQDGFRAVAFADDNSIVDREIAWRAGLGWFGKNANLLVPGLGSFVVLGCVVTTADLQPSPHPEPDGCGACTRCLDHCPTGAIVQPGVIDARRCLAWLLQRPGVFPREHRIALGDRFYGCDDCQDGCPPTLRAARDAPGASGLQAWIDPLHVLEATDDDLLEAYGRWYLAGRDPRWWRRNALLVVGNTADGRAVRVERALRRYLGEVDAVLRAHAVWAAARLGRHDLLPSTDTDPLVRDELCHLPASRTDDTP